MCYGKSDFFFGYLFVKPEQKIEIFKTIIQILNEKSILRN